MSVIDPYLFNMIGLLIFILCCRIFWHTNFTKIDTQIKFLLIKQKMPKPWKIPKNPITVSV